MLNNLIPTVIIDRVGGKLDTKGRVLYMTLTCITRPGKYFGIPQWSQTSAANIPEGTRATIAKELLC